MTIVKTNTAIAVCVVSVVLASSGRAAPPEDQPDDLTLEPELGSDETGVLQYEGLSLDEKDPLVTLANFRDVMLGHGPAVPEIGKPLYGGQ